jgi:anion-transporting  ArsA/GET3 family ATPase
MPPKPSVATLTKELEAARKWAEELEVRLTKANDTRARAVLVEKNKAIEALRKVLDFPKSKFLSLERLIVDVQLLKLKADAAERKVTDDDEVTFRLDPISNQEAITEVTRVFVKAREALHSAESERDWGLAAKRDAQQLLDKAKAIGADLQEWRSWATAMNDHQGANDEGLRSSITRKLWGT